MGEWLVLVYKVPADPSRYRLSVWRKLKAEGAIYLQNGIAALPLDSRSERVMRGLVQEIREIDGTAHLIQGGSVGDERVMEAAYNAARDEEYTEVIRRCHDFHAELERERAARNFTFAELEENEEDLAKLEIWLSKIGARDRLGAKLKAEAEHELAACRENLESFARSVYDVVDHGSAVDGSDHRRREEQGGTDER